MPRLHHACGQGSLGDDKREFANIFCSMHVPDVSKMRKICQGDLSPNLCPNRSAGLRYSPPLPLMHPQEFRETQMCTELFVNDTGVLPLRDVSFLRFWFAQGVRGCSNDSWEEGGAQEHFPGREEVGGLAV